MSSPSPLPSSLASPTKAAQTTFTSSDRIQQLSEIDTQISSILSHAGLALQFLTKPQTSHSQSALEASKAEFSSHTSAYFSTLSSIDVSLRRQIYALQEAGLIKAGTAKDAREAGGNAGTVRDIGRGTGVLETSWLNSRAKDKVGKQMERELWERAKELLEKDEGLGNATVADAKEVEDVSMENQDEKTIDTEEAEEIGD